MFIVVHSLSRVCLLATPWTAAHQASLSFTIFWNLLKLMSIELMMPSNHLILGRPLLLLPSIFPSIRVFSNDSLFESGGQSIGASASAFSSVQFSCSVVSDPLRPRESQHTRPPCPSPTPRVHSDSRPSSQWCHPAISSSVIPFSSCPHPSQHHSLFQWVNSSHKVAKVLEFQLQHHSFQRNPRADLLQNGLVGSPCSPRDSQESSPTPQVKSINSSVLSLLHSPTLTSIHDHWKNHSLD